MTPSERARRIGAAASVIADALEPASHASRAAPAIAKAVLDAAEEAVPMVSEAALQDLTTQHALQRAEWARTLKAESDRADRLEAELGHCTCPVGFGQVRAADCPRHNPKPTHTIDLPEVACGSTEASCTCILPVGHETKWHECECGGEWSCISGHFEFRSAPGTAPGWKEPVPKITGASWEEIKRLVAATKRCRLAMVGISEEQRQELIEIARQNGTEIEWMIDITQMHGIPDA